MKIEAMVEIRDLKKNFDEVRALDGVSLDILPGRIIGLLGANGSGKTTLLRHMIGLYLPSSGSCRTLGVAAAKLRSRHLKRIGFVHQENDFLDYLTVQQLIDYVAGHYKRWNAELEREYVERFEVPRDRKVGGLSPGLRQRVAILLAIGFEPELLILDEPASSLDPIARFDFLNLLLRFIQNPSRTIIISSHILTDVEKVIDHVLILDRGRMLRDTGLDDLREEFCRYRLTSLGHPLPATLPFQDVLDQERSDHQAIITMKSMPPDQVQTEARNINCRAEVLPLSFEELYRLVVAGGKVDSGHV